MEGRMDGRVVEGYGSEHEALARVVGIGLKGAGGWMDGGWKGVKGGTKPWPGWRARKDLVGGSDQMGGV